MINAGILNPNAKTYARMAGNVVLNVEVATPEWVASQEDPSIFIEVLEEFKAAPGRVLATDGYFYAPTPPFPSWNTQSNGAWLPTKPMPTDGDLYYWDENLLDWVK